MREGVGADHGLVRLYRITRYLGHKFGCRNDLGRIDARFDRENISPGAHRHDDLLEGRITRPFAEAVDRTLDLARTGQHGTQRIGDSQPEVVVAMDRPDDLVRIRNARDELTHRFGVLVRDVVADRIRNVDGGRPGLDHRLEDAAQEIEFGTPRILGGKLDVVRVFTGPADRPHGLLDDFVGRHAQLLFHVNPGRRDKGVDAPRRRRPDRLPGTPDVALVGPRQ